jgi:hypothetical protein
MFRPILILALATTLAAPASAFTAKNGMRVNPMDAQTFRVEFPSPDGEVQYLCAAGDYVMRALGMSALTRIYRASPPPRKRGQGITFTLDEGKKTKMALFTSFSANKGDGGIAAGTARDVYCDIVRIPDF